MSLGVEPLEKTPHRTTPPVTSKEPCHVSAVHNYTGGQRSRQIAPNRLTWELFFFFFFWIYFQSQNSHLRPSAPGDLPFLLEFLRSINLARYPLYFILLPPVLRALPCLYACYIRSIDLIYLLFTPPHPSHSA